MERDPRHHTSVNRVVSSALLAIVIGLIPWTVWLGLSLPHRFDAHHWNVAWIGFNTALIACLASCAWAIWARRQVMVPTALVAGTLLACDAWFDVLTSLGSRGEVLTLVTASCGELPLAAFFFVTAGRVMRRSVAAHHVALGLPGRPPRLREAFLVSARTELPGRPGASRVVRPGPPGPPVPPPGVGGARDGD